MISGTCPRKRKLIIWTKEEEIHSKLQNCISKKKKSYCNSWKYADKWQVRKHSNTCLILSATAASAGLFGKIVDEWGEHISLDRKAHTNLSDAYFHSRSWNQTQRHMSELTLGSICEVGNGCSPSWSQEDGTFYVTASLNPWINTMHTFKAFKDICFLKSCSSHV